MAGQARKSRISRPLRLEPLEPRWTCAASVGWDGPGQGQATLSYYIANTPSGLSASAVEAALTKALGAWSAVADVTFVPTSLPRQPNSIDFQFVRLDGAGGTLAQAYLPSDVNRGSIAGDVVFDAGERWEVGNALGSAAYDLVLVAVHEIGHALGLDHQRVAGSVMLPSVSANQQFTSLATTDVQAILGLYAPADSATTPAPSSPQQPKVNPPNWWNANPWSSFWPGTLTRFWNASWWRSRFLNRLASSLESGGTARYSAEPGDQAKGDAGCPERSSWSASGQIPAEAGMPRAAARDALFSQWSAHGFPWG